MQPPPGPFRPTFWRSPLRGPWLTTTLGSLLLPLVGVMALTGFLSHSAYLPDLGSNALVPVDRDLFVIGWTTHPSWLYAFTQGLHVVVGFVAVPLLLAKLWSVIPRLFSFPPARSPAQAIERLAIALLVGSALFEFVTGIANAQDWYPFPFGFVRAHYYGAWIFVGALALHVAVKVPTMRAAWRTQGVLRPLKDRLADTRPEPPDPNGLVPAAPAAPTISRRGLLAGVGAGSATLFVLTAGQSIGGPLRKLALLAPRGAGETGFPVNKTASLAKITPAMTGGDWMLELVAGGRTRRVSRPQLLAMELHDETLPIACVEGWSTTQTWRGVRLSDLAKLAGATPSEAVHVESLQIKGAFRQATLAASQLHDERALLALQVGGTDLSLDHGYPARIIVPALPGVHCTKWVGRMTFEPA